MATVGLVNGSGEGDNFLMMRPGLELHPSIQFVADFLNLPADETSPFCLFQR